MAKKSHMGMKGQPLHINVGDTSIKFKARQIARIINLMKALDKPGITNSRRSELEDEIKRRRAAMVAISAELPRTLPELNEILKRLK
jgi:hypothetical protein